MLIAEKLPISITRVPDKAIEKYMNLTKIDMNIKVWHNFLHIILWQGFRTSEVDPRKIVVNTKPFTQVCELHIKQ
jgi:hypothetical protein